MEIGFIGAGKVGTAMGIYLDSLGLSVSGYYSRSISSANKASLYINSNVYDDLRRLVVASDFLGITTTDDAITDVVHQLQQLSVNWKEKAFFHMSGVYSSKILEPLAKLGASVFSLHPMLSISDPPHSAVGLKDAFYTFEGTGNKRKEVLERISGWGKKVIEIAPKDKVMYHTAATVVSNYLVTVLDLGIQMLEKIGFSEDAAIEVIEPLVRKTLNNTIELGTVKALTGPISRGDIRTIHQHIENLNTTNNTWLGLYRVLGLQTVEIAERTGKLSQEIITQLKGELENG